MTSPFALTSGCGFALVGLALIASSAGPAAAQPRPRSGPKPTPNAEPPSPDPDVRAQLADQAAALAEAQRKLTEQQQQIEAMAAALAEATRDREAQIAADQALRDAIDAERHDRLAADGAARAAADAAPAAPAVRSAWPQLTLSGLVQIDATVRQSSEDELRQSGDPLNQDRFLLRRGRIRLTGTYDKLTGLAEIDINTVNGSQVRVSTAEVNYQLAPWLTAAIGLPKIPFGFEVEQSDKDRLFLERSTVVRALFPGEYDVGARLSGRWGFLRYAVAAQNGEPAGEKAFPLRDPNQDKDITARVGVDTPIGAARLAFGFSFLTGRGFHAGTPATKDVLVWKDVNEDGVVSLNEISVVPGQASTPSQNFDRFGLGGDALLALDLTGLGGLGKLTLYGELMVANNLDRAIVLADPVTTGRDLRELGYYGAAVYEPTAQWALGARYDRYDPDSDAAELRTGDVVPVDSSQSTLSVTAALRGSHGRLILQYDHNRNHSGRTASGVPTNLGDDAVTLRAEVQL